MKQKEGGEEGRDRRGQKKEGREQAPSFDTYPSLLLLDVSH